MNFLVLLKTPFGLRLYHRRPGKRLCAIARLAQAKDLSTWLPAMGTPLTVVVVGTTLPATAYQSALRTGDVIRIPMAWLNDRRARSPAERAAQALRLACTHQHSPIQQFFALDANDFLF